MEIRKREVSFDEWAKWAIQQDMHALAQPVSSITATSIADQIAQAKEMDTPVKFRGARELGQSRRADGGATPTQRGSKTHYERVALRAT